MATSTIFNFNFNNSEIVDSTGQWYDATTGTPTTEFINHDGNTALLQRAYIAETSYLRDINPVFFQSRDPTFTAHTYTIELQIYPLRDSGGFGPWDGPVLEFNTESDERGWVSLVSVQRASKSNTFYWHEYGLGPDGTGIPFLTVTAADGTYNRWYSIRIERVDDGTNTGATIKIYVDGTLVVNETLTYSQDARRGRIGSSIRYTYRRNSTSPEGAGVAIDNFKLTAGIAPSSVVDVSLANLQRNNANLLSFIKGKVPAVNDGALTIQKNGTNVATFTANQSTAATANITVPTAVSELTNDSGYLTSSSNLDASKLTSGTVDIARLPQGALERLIKVANEAARYALTTADVQLGDTVQQLDTGIMYIVTDADHLDSAAGYTEYTAGTAASVPWSGVTGKPTFAAVATSGAYSDLTGTPTIPTVNDATLTIQKNGTDVATFSANSSTNATANITVPTKTSDLNNDSGFITGVAWDDVTNKPSFATVATSGNYNDLSNKPTIPTVNNATLTIQKNGTTVQTFTANQSTNATANITVPTKTSDLTNDSGFITSDNTKIPLAGSNAISGSLIPSTDGTVNLGGSSYQWNQAYIKSLTINGTACGNILTHNASEFVPRSGGAVMTGGFLFRNVSDNGFRIGGGVATNDGSTIAVYGKDYRNRPGWVHLEPNNGTTIKMMELKPDGTWTWNGTACQITSDQRLKQQITEIDDKLLDAWEDVNLVQFKYNDAVDTKKDKARLHTGYVVQQIDKACKSHNVDISEYGLYCHEEYPEETEEVEVEQADGTKVKERKVIREASEHYSLRYTEALVVECKYLRRCIARLTARIEQLEKGKEQEASK